MRLTVGKSLVLIVRRLALNLAVMDIRDGFIGSIGHTPLIKLRHASEETGCLILGKA